MPMGYHNYHPSASPRPGAVGLASLLLAVFTLLASTVGQAYILFTASTNILSNAPYTVSSTDMLSAFAAFLSIVGGSWLLALTKPRENIPRDIETEPLLETFDNEKIMMSSVVLEISERRENLRSAEVIYLPYFIAGNVCLGLWVLSRLAEWYITSQVALLVNLIVQNYAVFIALHSWRRPELRMNSKTWTTHILSKGNAAVAVLFLWKNSGILERCLSPTIPEMLNNGTIFILMAIGGGPDPTLGLFLLYDLYALAYRTGAVAEWQAAFQYTALAVFLILAWDLSQWVTKPSSRNIMDDVEDDIVEGEIRLQPENDDRYGRLLAV